MKRKWKRHWYEVEWEDTTYVVCDFPGGVLVSMSGWATSWWKRLKTQFVPGWMIDHTTTPLTLIERLDMPIRVVPITKGRTK